MGWNGKSLCCPNALTCNCILIQPPILPSFIRQRRRRWRSRLFYALVSRLAIAIRAPHREFANSSKHNSLSVYAWPATEIWRAFLAAWRKAVRLQITLGLMIGYDYYISPYGVHDHDRVARCRSSFRTPAAAAAPTSPSPTPFIAPCSFPCQSHYNSLPADTSSFFVACCVCGIFTANRPRNAHSYALSSVWY